MMKYLTIFLIAIGYVILCFGAYKGNTHAYTIKVNNSALSSPYIPVVNPLTVEGVWLGRLLFYDTLLSGNNKQSCGSCHRQELSFTDGYKTAIGAYGDTTNRNTMSLVNLAWQSHFFWDGRVSSLEQLIRQPVMNVSEMNQDTVRLIEELKKHGFYPRLFELAFPDDTISMNTVSKAIAQFLRTIVSDGVKLPDSISQVNYASLDKDSASLIVNKWEKEKNLRGTFIRVARLCSNCHTGSFYGGIYMANNLLQDKGDLMKAPSLINVSMTGPYMHDGRFSSLEEVMKHYNKHISQIQTMNPGLIPYPVEDTISDYDLAHSKELFRLFTDSSLLKNEAFKNPFIMDGFKWFGY